MVLHPFTIVYQPYQGTVVKSYPRPKLTIFFKFSNVVLCKNAAIFVSKNCEMLLQLAKAPLIVIAKQI